MIEASSVIGYLKRNGYNFYSGVPCSILKSLLKNVIADEDIRYIPAVRENAELGVASGGYLAGRKSCVLMQNSGLGNIINAMTSFNLIYKIPVLMFISWRGFKGKDAPEHIIMGKKTLSLLKELSIPYRILTERYEKDIDWALKQIERHSIPTVLILKKDLIK